MPMFEYWCNDCNYNWETDGDRTKCPECRSEDYSW